MKIVFIGAGAHRYLGIARSILDDARLFADTEVHLYDPARERAKAMAKMIRQSPECRNAGAKIVVSPSLNKALVGADVVHVVLFADSKESFHQGKRICAIHGFAPSDQLSPSGAMLALRGGPILMDIAKRMEKLCPQAWLINFANPVAVLSAAVNNHTRIRSLGVCNGFVNHFSDLPRLMGRDEEDTEFDALSVGINHLSFIRKNSTYRGSNLYEAIDEAINRQDWRPLKLSNAWSPQSRKVMRWGLVVMRRIYLQYGWLVFTNEGDGMWHLDIAGEYDAAAARAAKVTLPQLRKNLESGRTSRQAAEDTFRNAAKNGVPAEAWTNATAHSFLAPADNHLMVRITRALAGGKPARIATSFPHGGAVAGFPDRVVMDIPRLFRRRDSGRVARPRCRRSSTDLSALWPCTRHCSAMRSPR